MPVAGQYVYSSNPVTLHRLVVEGTIDPQALPELGTRHVAHVLRGLEH